MELKPRGIYGLIHGIVLGSIFLLSFGATMVWFNSYKIEFLSDTGISIRNKRMKP